MALTLPSGKSTEVTRIPYANFAFHVGFEALAKGFPPAKDVDEMLFGGFSEISGLEAMMEHRIIKEGGRNYGPAVRAGPVSFGTVVMKRGIVRSQHLWRWWSMFAGADNAPDGRPMPENRCNLLIGLVSTIGSSDPKKVESKIRIGWRLRNAMPVKFRVGDLNGKGTDVAVEELHLVHEGLEMKDVVA